MAVDVEPSGVRRPRSGVPPAEARRRVRVHFGSVDGAKDGCRQTRGLRLVDEAGHVMTNIRPALRMLLKTPVVTGVAVPVAGLPGRGRTRELVVRSALGARPAALLGLVLAGGGRVVVLGVGGGAVLALAAARVVAGATGGVAASDPVVSAGAMLLVAGVAAAAHVGPARRVVRLDLKRALQVD